MTRLLQLTAVALFAVAVGIILWCGPKQPRMLTHPPEAQATRQVLDGADSVQALTYLRRKQVRWLRKHPGAPRMFPNMCNLCTACCTATPAPIPHMTSIDYEP